MKIFRSWLPFLLALFVFLLPLTVTVTYAQTSLSGDEVCGATAASKCSIKDFATITKKVLIFIISLGLPILVLFIAVRFLLAWKSLAVDGNVTAYHDALKKASNAVLGFLMITGLVGGLLFFVLNYFGVRPEFLRILNLLTQSSVVERAYAADGCSQETLSKACVTTEGKEGKCSAVDRSASPSSQNISYECVPSLVIKTTDQNGKTNGVTVNPETLNNQAYQNQISGQQAVNSKHLPNPVGVDNLYDFLLQAVRLVVRFFVYPALIAMWVWTGFSFVFAQGAPEKLNKAKKLLLWAFFSTLIIFMIQGFLLALQGSVAKILGK
jgi:hypothetical protein